MPVKNTKSRTSSTKGGSMTKMNQITVIVICAVFVMVGLFLVYRSFAAVVPK